MDDNIMYWKFKKIPHHVFLFPDDPEKHFFTARIVMSFIMGLPEDRSLLNFSNN